jgi:hypothetical protein
MANFINKFILLFTEKDCYGNEIGGSNKIYNNKEDNVDGNKQFALKKEFPKYGLKSMRSSRAHISLDGRVIEAIPIYQLLDKEANHNDYNGYKAFVILYIYTFKLIIFTIITITINILFNILLFFQ